VVAREEHEVRVLAARIAGVLQRAELEREVLEHAEATVRLDQLAIASLCLRRDAGVRRCRRGARRGLAAGSCQRRRLAPAILEDQLGER
jgi:hypothetical protein